MPKTSVYFRATNPGYKVCRKQAYFRATNHGYKVCRKQAYTLEPHSLAIRYAENKRTLWPQTVRTRAEVFYQYF
jgi:hypothetical protein